LVYPFYLANGKTSSIAFHKNNQKLLPSDAIFELEMHKNAFAAGASPQTRLGQLTALPRIASWITGEREGREVKGGDV